MGCGVLVALLAAFVVWPRGHSTSAALEPPAAPTSKSAAVASPTSPSLQAPADQSASGAPPAVPVRVSVPRVGIDSGLEPLGLLANGTLQSPSKWERAGWYAKGVRPGAVGPAVIAGHVDSVSGPAVFYRLRDVRVGDDIAVTDAQGQSRHFTVTDVKEYPKSAFPTAAVYGSTALPVLRLVTCTGDFDYQAHSYLDNLVVSAALAEPAVF